MLEQADQGSGGVTTPGSPQKTCRHFVIWFSGQGGIQSKATLDDLEGVFQP